MTHVLIAGAGPVGAVLALAASQRGMQVTLVEEGTDIDPSPRAATMHPSTLDMLDDLGLMDAVLRQGLLARYFDYWDRPTRTLTARLDHEVLRGFTRHPYVVQLEQHKLVRIVLDLLATRSGVDVRLGRRLDGIEQDAEGVTATVECDGRRERISADYLLGADGGRSTVRKSQDIEFEGYTWPERFLVLTTTYDFQQEWECSFRDYMADPDEWVNLFKVAGDDMRGRWRAVFPAPAEETDDEAMSDEAVARRLGQLSEGGDPFAGVVHRKVYRVHQRVAAAFRRGRVFLAGDAAHVNNPIGGLGLNSGIHDAVDLIDVLERSEGGDVAALDGYEARRRSLNIEFVQQQTVANKKRLEEKDPEQRRARAAELAAIGADPEKQRAMLMRTSLLESVVKSGTISA